MEKASERAVGPNKQALQILLAANGIPHQHDNVLSGSGTMRGPVNSSAYVGDKRPFQVWTNQFGYGVSRDNTRHHTPLSSPLGTFHLDSTELAHNGLTIPVDNLSITAEVPVNDDDTYGEAATVMHLNTRPYDPNEPLGKSNDFSGGVRLDIAPDGTLIKVGSTHDDRRGYWDVNPATVTTNLSEFLGGVQRAVEQTAEAYTQLPR
jgi:hypothetical protein